MSNWAVFWVAYTSAQLPGFRWNGFGNNYTVKDGYPVYLTYNFTMPTGYTLVGIYNAGISGGTGAVSLAATRISWYPQWSDTQSAYDTSAFTLYGEFTNIAGEDMSFNGWGDAFFCDALFVSTSSFNVHWTQ